MPCGEVPVLIISSFVEWLTLDTPCDKVSVLLISWFTERAITDNIFCRFCMFAKFCLQLWCHLWHHGCNDPTPNMHVLTCTINSSFTSDGVKSVSCPGNWKTLKYGNRSMEMEVWKYVSEMKAVYWRLVPYWLTTVPSQRARRLFFSLPYFCFHTSVAALQHFPLACSLMPSSHVPTRVWAFMKVLDCILNMLRVRLLQLWGQRWHHSKDL